VTEIKYKYYKGILHSQFIVPEIDQRYATRVGSIQLEPRYLFKDPIEIAEKEFVEILAGRHSEGAIAWQRRFIDSNSNESFQLKPHVYQRHKAIVEFDRNGKEYAEIVEEIFVEYSSTQADEAYKSWDFIAQKYQKFHGKITGTGFCKVPILKAEEREIAFAELIEIERIKSLKARNGCLSWFIPRRGFNSLLPKGTLGLNGASSNKGCMKGCTTGGCGGMGCGILSLLALLGLLLGLWRGCQNSDIKDDQSSNRVIHDTVYIKEEAQVKEFVDTTTIKRTDAILLPNVQFYTNSANLLPYSIRSIQELANYMVAHPNIEAVIKGHTDDVGEAEANLILSQSRAETVKKVLISLGIQSERLEAKGFGEQMPKTRDETVEGRAINRRVEVELFNTEETETIRSEKIEENGD
jgi:outer membrane protein OmpA-like peptidoglycan-associated protein